MRVALDTNVLVYAEGVNGDLRGDEAVELIKKLPDSSTFPPGSSAGRAVPGSDSEIRPFSVLRWQKTYPLIETSSSVLVAAIDLAVDHGLNIWDAVILAAASEASCRLLLSEDLQDGFTWGGVTVVNPFGGKRNELLAQVLR